jgi:NADH-ubiquinone oxidoreductase chain 5
MFSLIFVAVFGGRLLRWVIFHAPSMICLPFYLRFLTIFVCLLGGRVGYELSIINLGGSLVSLLLYNPSLTLR